MSISGLVVTLAADDVAAEGALVALQSDPRLHVGVRSGRRVALVAETGSGGEDRELLEDLDSIPGVAHTNVVYVEVGR